MASTLIQKVTEPWLIQRAEIQKPLADPKEATLTKSLSLDYMGSAEFEFGALPASLRRMRASGSLQTRLVKSIRQGDSPLRVFSYLDDETFPQYARILSDLRHGDPRLKEVSRFSLDYPQDGLKTDFWWDIENDVIWSFDKNYMSRLPRYLENSFSVMS
jgi:hypothetical protein